MLNTKSKSTPKQLNLEKRILIATLITTLFGIGMGIFAYITVVNVVNETSFTRELSLKTKNMEEYIRENIDIIDKQLSNLTLADYSNFIELNSKIPICFTNNEYNRILNEYPEFSTRIKENADQRENMQCFKLDEFIKFEEELHPPIFNLFLKKAKTISESYHTNIVNEQYLRTGSYLSKIESIINRDSTSIQQKEYYGSLLDLCIISVISTILDDLDRNIEAIKKIRAAYLTHFTNLDNVFVDIQKLLQKWQSSILSILSYENTFHHIKIEELEVPETVTDENQSNADQQPNEQPETIKAKVPVVYSKDIHQLTNIYHDWIQINGSIKKEIITATNAINNNIYKALTNEIYEISDHGENIADILIVVLIISVVLGFILTTSAPKNVTFPLRRLINLIEDLKDGRYTISQKLESSDDTGILFRHLHSLVRVQERLDEQRRHMITVFNKRFQVLAEEVSTPIFLFSPSDRIAKQDKKLSLIYANQAALDNFSIDRISPTGGSTPAGRPIEKCEFSTKFKSMIESSFLSQERLSKLQVPVIMQCDDVEIKHDTNQEQKQDSPSRNTVKPKSTQAQNEVTTASSSSIASSAIQLLASTESTEEKPEKVTDLYPFTYYVSTQLIRDKIGEVSEIIVWVEKEKNENYVPKDLKETDENIETDESEHDKSL